MTVNKASFVPHLLCEQKCSFSYILVFAQIHYNSVIVEYKWDIPLRVST